MKKLTILVVLIVLSGCASKKPKLSQEELRKIRTQPVVFDIRQPEGTAQKQPIEHNGTINITKHSQTAEEKKQAKLKSRQQVNEGLDTIIYTILAN